MKTLFSEAGFALCLFEVHIWPFSEHPWKDLILLGFRMYNVVLVILYSYFQ